MTAGTDGKTIDAMSLERMDRLIATLKDESYQPKPSRRTYIPKKNGKLRPLGIPSIDDKLVQEVVRMLLESIYENSFEDTSHGFRPNKSCHTALRMIQNRFTRCKWFVEGDIKGFFDNIDHNVMVAFSVKELRTSVFCALSVNFSMRDIWRIANCTKATAALRRAASSVLFLPISISTSSTNIWPSLRSGLTVGTSEPLMWNTAS